MSMSQKVREELLPRLRQRYMGRGKKGRGALLDEVCEQFGYSRKHAIKLLGAKAGWGGNTEAYNFFLPCAKLEAKSRHGAKVQRKHDKPKTPCDRLLESEHVSVEAKEKLRARRAELDPFELHDRLEEGLRRVLPFARTSSRPKASLRCGPNEGKKK
jgi:hypothetical protein